jgi:site-specific DNA-adenine methylase
MWGYYGSKSKVINHYPAPIHDLIIEPFAGTAQYALKYFDRDVILIDKYDVIVKLWQWLQKCSPQDILETRRLKYGDNVDDFEWDCVERKWMVGFIIAGAPAQPKKTATRWKTVLRPNTQEYKLKLISESLYKIRHWNIKQGVYQDVDNRRATWYVDPPYVDGGQYYRHGNKHINFEHLARWCCERKGQTIVCEKTGADWLPFEHLIESRGAKKQHCEAIWTNESTGS